MSKWFYFIFVSVNLAVSLPVFAKVVAIKAITININADGRPLDNLARTKVRKISGAALADGVIDVFIINVPKSGGQLYIEGGLFACAEPGYYSTPKRFDLFIKKLRGIHPKAGTTVNIKTATSCVKATPLYSMCGGIAGMACPIGQVCVDDIRDSCDPKKGGADCSGICKKK